ncbi:MAG: GAF domain-containing protein [Actinobacteria bacterium]|nr:GAF domain-containing protein [Actinomycetota bacterium]
MAEREDMDRFRRLQHVTDAALTHLELEPLVRQLETAIQTAVEAEYVRIRLGDRARFEHGISLLYEDRLLGVLQTDTAHLDDRQLEILRAAIDRAARAIGHAQRFEYERRGRERLERVQVVTDAALAHLELEELLHELLVRIRDVLGVDTTAILLLDHDTNELVARSAVGLEEEVEQGVRIPVGRGFAGRVAAEKRPVILPDVDHADVLNPILREKGIKSMLGVPLLAQGHVLGVLHVGTLVPYEFGLEHVELLQLVADRAAIAIEKARVHEELRRVDQLKLNFVAVASHELRTPATSVYGIVATLRERGDTLSAETREELEETLWSQTVRLRRLIEQLLDLSRLDSQAIEIHPEPLGLRNLVRELANALVDPREESIDIEIEPGFAVLADRLALERIVSNLLSNAFRYGKPPVRVSAEQGERHLRIAIEDSGEGVPDELVPRLFERFERGLSGHGTGLGLAIAKAYATAHGGDLVYETPEEGGARFEVLLPA